MRVVAMVEDPVAVRARFSPPGGPGMAAFAMD